ncbi:MmgE/PrpD family protein [Ornithinibacillus sp. 4-3]|uniref:MmgE/PrpD family protein n=1 Tax=Ornithinibacillus sp. 4-3 TaxID=3231488 RepID=A0AB39HQQ0_9BACI
MTKKLAELIYMSDPSQSDKAMEEARLGILDFLASAFPGTTDPNLNIIWDTIVNSDAVEQTTVYGKKQKVGQLNAVLYNGYAGHALDFDDVHSGMGGHPSTVILPVLFSLAEVRKCSARDLLKAYIVGIEVAGKVGKALGNIYEHKGFHSTSVIGGIGAAAAGAYLLNLNIEEITNAIGLAATQASGLKIHFGSPTKPLHAGLAAQAGLMAVLLAEKGLKGSEEVFDGPISFFAAYGSGDSIPETAVQNWGEPWQILEPGLQYKPYPCCFATHVAADIILKWKKQNLFSNKDISKINITFPPDGDAALIVRNPKNGYDGRFSMEYVAAVAIIEGNLGVEFFKEQEIREDIKALMNKVERLYDENAESVSINKDARFTHVEIILNNQTTFAEKGFYPKGTRDIKGKFNSVISGNEKLKNIPNLVEEMNSVKDLEKLISLFREVK